jgi:hypothetical protein
MIYTANDVQFEQLNPVEFERLCFDLLLKLGYRQLTWRQGGADNGRDIEGRLHLETPLTPQVTRWFFEWKHYTNGVPPEHLNSKIAWADGEQPDYLLIFVSSYLSNNARIWIDQIRSQKRYSILVIEGPELKVQLLRFPKLIEQHFSANKYELLLLDAKRHFQAYHISPSYELISAIASKIDPERLALNDIGFLFISLYKQFEYLEDRNDYYGDFDPAILNTLYQRLETLCFAGRIELFEPYKGNYDYLGGSGFWDDLESWEPGLEGESDAEYQYNTFHLNYKGSNESWALGHYLFFRLPNGAAFELFSVENSEFTTGSRYFPQVSIATIDELCLVASDRFRIVLHKYAKIFR